jgi:hypothetical protein
MVPFSENEDSQQPGRSVRRGTPKGWRLARWRPIHKLAMNHQIPGKKRGRPEGRWCPAALARRAASLSLVKTVSRLSRPRRRENPDQEQPKLPAASPGKRLSGGRHCDLHRLKILCRHRHPFSQGAATSGRRARNSGIIYSILIYDLSAQVFSASAQANVLVFQRFW